MKSRFSASGALAAGAVVIAVAACGGEPAPRDAAQDLWDAFRSGVADSASSDVERAAQGRRRVCYALHTPLRNSVADSVGATVDFPDCEFLRNVTLLNGSARLGDLQHLRFDGEQRAEAEFEAAGETHAVAMRRINPYNWEIVGLR
jgi:hypothetical protein